MSWDAHLEILAEAGRAKQRYVVMEVWPYDVGVPVERQSFDELIDAFDLADELTRIHAGAPARYVVVDREHVELGYLDREVLYAPEAS